MNSTVINERERIISLIKIFYWVIALLFSVAFTYFSGIDFRETNIRNQRVQAIILGLMCGNFLVYFNIFHTNYDSRERLISSLIYIFCLSMMAYIYKPLLYDSSSYIIEPSQSFRYPITPAVFIVTVFAIFIWNLRN
jgi:hypothetical protein